MVYWFYVTLPGQDTCNLGVSSCRRLLAQKADSGSVFFFPQGQTHAAGQILGQHFSSLSVKTGWCREEGREREREVGEERRQKGEKGEGSFTIFKALY